MLLNHTSGLPAWFPLYRRTTSRAEAIDTLYQVPLKHAPGAMMEYSDLNAILLGLLVETVTGESLARFAQEGVFAPLGMRHVFFMPDIPPYLSVAASRIESGKPRAGVVNDKNAERFGGIAGHAGLFATGLDLARFAQTWLREGQTADYSWVTPATVRLFLEHDPQLGARALGWEIGLREAPAESAYGSRATPYTYGHTGWTGTFLWFDPTRDLFLVFLTNRSLTPTTGRSLRAMRAVRNQVSEAIANLVPPRCVAVAVAVC
jgi:CubicO group peptidase (beta-lactamase class C family)